MEVLLNLARKLSQVVQLWLNFLFLDLRMMKLLHYFILLKFSYAFWLLCGDFNVIRFKHEKSSYNFQNKANAFFNAFLDDYNLIEYELSSRRFTWSNGR
jgi:hypothetical protein